jgi:ribosomal-protein-alanine N-acetyltransferase
MPEPSEPVKFIAGTLVYLRPFGHEDLSGPYSAWMNDPEVTCYMESGIFPNTADDLEKFFRDVTGSRNQVILAVVDKKTHQHIGNVKLGPIDWVHRRAHFGILIGEKKFWGKGVGAEATRLIVEYAFERLNLNRVDLGVYAEHQAAVRCYEGVGFKIEGRLRQDLFHHGEHKDRLWMGLLRSEYKPAEARKTEARKTKLRPKR